MVFCRHGKHVYSISVFATVAILLFSTGCATDFGYRYETQSSETKIKEEECNERHFAVVNAQDDQIEVTCFRKYDLKETISKKETVVGKKHFYRAFKPGAYFDNAFLNPFKKYDSITKEVFKKHDPITAKYGVFPAFNKTFNALGNPQAYNDPVSQLIVTSFILVAWAMDVSVLSCTLVCDAFVYMCAPMVDATCTLGCWTWSAIAMPMQWLGGRMFGWLTDWNLEENVPDAFTMTSYMPFINLMFPFQTPPYLVNKEYRYSKSCPLDKPVTLEEKIVKRTIAKQAKHTNCELSAKLFCNGDLLTEGKFISDGYNGNVKLGKFVSNTLEKHKNNISIGRNLELKLVLRKEGKEILNRTVTIDYNDIMPASNRNDLALYNSRETDFLNRILLRHRSHPFWGEDLLDDSFSDIQNRYSEIKALKTTD